MRDIDITRLGELVEAGVLGFGVVWLLWALLAR